MRCVKAMLHEQHLTAGLRDHAHDRMLDSGEVRTQRGDLVLRHELSEAVDPVVLGDEGIDPLADIGG